MQRYVSIFLSCVLLLVVLSGCAVPTPPPELPTPTPGSRNPESEMAQLRQTPVRIEPAREYSPISAPEGHIYFARASGLWRVAPDGSGQEQLSDLPVSSPPQPSPDGKLVAFISGDSLYVVLSEGGEARKIASGLLPERQRLGWTPGSDMVGYITLDRDRKGGEDAWAVPVEGGEPVLIAELDGRVVARGPSYERTVQWSPDGKWVVVASVNNPMFLFRWPLSHAREGDVRLIAGGEPDWSPDSRTLLYTETLFGALHMYFPLTSDDEPFRNEQQLVGTGYGDNAQGPGPRWSPASVGVDSDLIAYRSRSEQGEPRVSIRRRGGRDIAPLPSLTNNPAWSLGGDRLVVETGTVEAGALGSKWMPGGLAITTLNVGGEHALTPLVEDGQWPAWGR